VAEAIKALGKIRDKPSLSSIGEMLNDEDPRVRAAVAETFGNYGDKSIIPQLKNLLKDQDEDVRRAAVVALGKLGDPMMLMEILTLGRTDRGPCVRAAAIESAINIISKREACLYLEIDSDSLENFKTFIHQISQREKIPFVKDIFFEAIEKLEAMKLRERFKITEKQVEKFVDENSSLTKDVEKLKKDVENLEKEKEKLNSELKMQIEELAKQEEEYKKQINAIGHVEEAKKKPILKYLVFGALSLIIAVEGLMLYKSVKLQKEQALKIEELNKGMAESKGTANIIKSFATSEEKYKKIVAMDGVMNLYLNDTTGLKLAYEGRKLKEAEKLLRQCTDKYWTGTPIEKLGLENAYLLKEKYYTIAQQIMTGELEKAKEEYRAIDSLENR